MAKKCRQLFLRKNGVTPYEFASPGNTNLSDATGFRINEVEIIREND